MQNVQAQISWTLIFAFLACALLAGIDHDIRLKTAARFIACLELGWLVASYLTGNLSLPWR